MLPSPRRLPCLSLCVSWSPWLRPAGRQELLKQHISISSHCLLDNNAGIYMEPFLFEVECSKSNLYNFLVRYQRVVVISFLQVEAKNVVEI